MNEVLTMKDTEEKEFDITISHTMSVMAESYEDAVEWVKNHVATQGRHIDFDIEKRRMTMNKPSPNDVSNALFNINDVNKTIKANGLCNTKRVHGGTDNEDTLGDLVEDLVYFLTKLDNIYGVHNDNE